MLSDEGVCCSVPVSHAAGDATQINALIKFLAGHRPAGHCHRTNRLMVIVSLTETFCLLMFAGNYQRVTMSP